jgi:hypothetical protein
MIDSPRGVFKNHLSRCRKVRKDVDPDPPRLFRGFKYVRENPDLKTSSYGKAVPGDLYTALIPDWVNLDYPCGPKTGSQSPRDLHLVTLVRTD